MNTKKYLRYALALLMLGGCEQEVAELEPLPVDTTNVSTAPDCTGASKGSADFTKFVAIGNSYVAGMQAFSLFNESQANSLPKILSTQFTCVGGNTTFNQPDINSVNGYNALQSIPGVLTLGRTILFDPDGAAGPRTAAPYPAGFPGSSVTCPSAVTTPALPAPYNTADLPAAFTGNKTTLNNFGVPLIFLGQALIPQTGGPPTSNPYYNPWYARFASNPGTSTIVGDALAAAGTFYLIWLGFDDVLLNAATGASGAYPMTSASDFNTQFNGLTATMLGTNPTFKGVVGNIPNFTTLPFFTTVTWNAITLDAATAATLTTNLANNYNAFLDAMVANAIITSDERAKRRLTYVEGKNGVLLTDETLTDLSPYMTGPYAALAPYARARQATSSDLIVLTAGSVLGTCVSNNPQAVLGVSYPVADQYVLIPSETTLILTRTAEFNAVISAAVSGSSNRLALADVKTAYGDVQTQSIVSKGMLVNGVTIASSFAPPAGMFSEDGLHPNSRGYAFTANVFIDAINAKFGASVPKVNLAGYKGTGLPINP